jgi:hypothetical protein
MNRTLLTGLIGAALVLTPLGFGQQAQENQHPKKEDAAGVQRAIAFQRAKDRADARQARLEARHPSVDYSNADRRMDDSEEGHHLKDPGAAPQKKDKDQY